MPAIVRHIIHQFNNSLLEKIKRNVTALDERLDCKIYSKSKNLKCRRKNKIILKYRKHGSSPSSSQCSGFAASGAWEGAAQEPGARPRPHACRWPCRTHGLSHSMRAGVWAEVRRGVQGVSSSRLGDTRGQSGGGGAGRPGGRSRAWLGWKCNTSQMPSSKTWLEAPKGARAPAHISAP